MAQAEFTSAEQVKSSQGSPRKPWLSWGVLGDVAQYLGMDAFFNLK